MRKEWEIGGCGDGGGGRGAPEKDRQMGLW